MRGQAARACNRHCSWCRATPSSRPSPPRGRRSQKCAKRREMSGSLSPIGGEGWGEGASRPRLQQALLLVPRNPLIPAFSPKGEKESEVRDCTR